MNEYDSDCLAQSLIRCGFSAVDDPGSADLILINTCTVRAKAEQKAFSMLGRMSAVKRKNPDLILGVVGCLAQQEGANFLKRFPQLDLVVGPRQIGEIPGFLERVTRDCEKVVATDLNTDPASIIPCQGYSNKRITGYISIMEGCNNFCSYCIVPFVRGREFSRSPEEILLEAGTMVSEGIKEITLLGQNVNSYLWTRGRTLNFASLLREFNELDGLLRLRFTTSHPKDLSDEVIECFGGDLANLCPHIHLPFQAGSNEVLQRMRRGYTREEYMALIGKLRLSRPDIAITSDVMVGFPGESEQDFRMTLDLMEAVQFDALFSFKYSDRKGTLAEKMREKIEETEMNSRLSVLQSLQKRITLKKNRELEGKQFEVLVEGESKRGGQLTGRTGSNKIVNFDCPSAYIGHIVNVVVDRGSLNSLQGEFLSTMEI